MKCLICKKIDLKTIIDTLTLKLPGHTNLLCSKCTKEHLKWYNKVEKEQAEIKKKEIINAKKRIAEFKKSSMTKEEWVKSHPTGTWCNSCKGPVDCLVCPICESYLNPNFF